MRNCIYALLCIVGLSCTKSKVDLIIHNTVIYTVDDKFSTAEAMVIHEGEIIDIGASAEILKKYNAKEKINADGKVIYPGFVDAHAHFTGYGQSLFNVDLTGCNGWHEALERVKSFAIEHSEEPWIKGRGWDQNKWPGGAYPTNDLLNILFPNKPVILMRIDGHAAIVNDKVLQLAGIQPNQTIPGGEIEVKNGKLTGVLVDNAVDLVTKLMPKPTKADYEKWLIAAQKNCFRQGLTTIADCGLMHHEIDIIDSLQKAEKLQMRLYVMLSDDPANYNKYLTSGPIKTDRLYVKGVKVYADGALGSRGACLLHPYSDKPDSKGFLLHSASHVDSVAQILINTDFQMCTHAIGDSANREVLKVYNKYLKGKNDKRWRIEHAQVVNQDDFGLFGAASVIPSVQPIHATSDMNWADERLGAERLKGAYAYKQLLEQNGWLPLGTDFPVEDISPFKNIFAAVVRKDIEGYPIGGFQMENALSREQAIRGMTIWAAKANCMEKEVGSLEKGKKADFIMLDKDVMKINEREILKVKVLATYINGQKVNGK